MNRIIRKAAAGAMAFVLAGAVMPVKDAAAGETDCIMTASAAGSIEFDSYYGTLYLDGDITVADLDEYRYNYNVRSIVARPGTVLPEYSAELFRSFYAESIDLSQADLSRTGQIYGMFRWCRNLESIDLSGFDTSRAEDLSSMFEGCLSLRKLDLRSFDTGNVNQMQYMFAACPSLETILVGPGWSTESLYNPGTAMYMFAECESLVGGAGTVYDPDITDGSYARIDSPEAPGYLTEAPQIDFKFSHNVNLSNSLGIVYYVPAAALEGYENIRLAVNKEVFAPDGTVSMKETVLTDPVKDNSSYGDEYVFRYNGITAKEMSSSVHAVIYGEKDGRTCWSSEDVYSIREYARHKIPVCGDNYKLFNAIHGMLNYGAAAQAYFGYNTGDPANIDFSDFQKDVEWFYSQLSFTSADKVLPLEGAKAAFSGKTLNLGNNIALVYFMTFDGIKDKSNVSLRLTYKTVTGQTKTQTVPFSRFTKGDTPGEYRYDLASLAAKDSMQPVEAVILDNGRPVSDTITYGIPTYASRKLANANSSAELRHIIKAMMVYYNNAKEYFT